ncbi:MAG: MFS transporter [Bryobacteraceae bacterium]
MPPDTFCMPVDINSQLDSRRAWVVAFAAFLGSFVSFGLTYCFGVFLKPMSLEFHASHAVMSALFSTITGLSFFLAPFTGDIADHYGPRPVVGAGAVLMGAGLILTAHVHSLPLIFLTYGVGLGTAVACTYIPAIAAVGEWFKLRRDLALGIAISGIGCGTLVAAPLAANLIGRYGWRTTFEIFGWTGAALLLLCAGLLARPPAIVEKKKVSLTGKIRTRTFAFLYISLSLAGIAIYVSLVFLPAYAVEIGASRARAAALLGYIGASSVVGRLGLNVLALRFGLTPMYRIAYAALLVSFGFWLLGHSYSSLVVFALAMGVGYGGIAAMAPAITAALFGIEGLGELLGILFTGFSVACLIGPPLAGALVDYTLDYNWAVFIAAAASVLALIFVFPLPRSS